MLFSFLACFSQSITVTATMTEYMTQYTITYFNNIAITASSFPIFVKFESPSSGTVKLIRYFTNGSVYSTDTITDSSQLVYIITDYPIKITASTANLAGILYIYGCCGFTGCENGLQVFTQSNLNLSLVQGIPSSILPIFPNQNRCFILADTVASISILNNMSSINSAWYHIEGDSSWTTIASGSKITSLSASSGDDIDVVFIKLNIGNFTSVPDFQINFTGKSSSSTEIYSYYEISIPTPLPTPPLSLTPFASPVSTPFITPIFTQMNSPSETPSITPSLTPVNTPSYTHSVTPFDTPKITPAASPSTTLKTTPISTPSSTPSKTASSTETVTISTAIITLSQTIPSATEYSVTPRWTVKPTQTPYNDGYEGSPYESNPVTVAIKDTNAPLQTDYIKTEVPMVVAAVNITSGTVVVVIVIVYSVVNFIRSAHKINKIVKLEDSSNASENLDTYSYESFTISDSIDSFRVKE